jgi:hypothetical protein
VAKVREVTRCKDIVSEVQKNDMAANVAKASPGILALAKEKGLLAPIQIGKIHVFNPTPTAWFPLVMSRATLMLDGCYYRYTVRRYLFNLILIETFYTNSTEQIYESTAKDHEVSVENMRAVRSMIEAVVPEV